MDRYRSRRDRHGMCGEGDGTLVPTGIVVLKLSLSRYRRSEASGLGFGTLR